MEVQMLDKHFEVENKSAGIESLFETLNDFLKSHPYALSHMIIDQEEVYDDHYDFINERVSSIKRVEICVVPYQQLADQMMLSAEQYLQGAIPQLGRLSAEFYKGPSSGSWLDLEQCFEGLQQLNGMAAALQKFSGEISTLDISAWSSFGFTDCVHEMEEALKHQDTILIADILTHEITPLYESLLQQVKKFIDNGVVGNDLN